MAANPGSAGYYLVDPGLGLPKYGLNPNNPDAQVRGLAYLIGRIPELNLAPQEAEFKIIVCQFTSGPYPAIVMYTETFVDTPDNMMGLSLLLEDKLGAIVSEMGIEWLMELSFKEPLSWRDILQRSEHYRNWLL